MLYTLFVMLIVIYISSWAILIYGILQKNLDLTFLIMPLVAWGGIIVVNIFTLLKDAYKEELSHSEKLVKEIFENPIAVCGIDYDEDTVFITQTEENVSEEIIILEDVYDKDKINQLCVRWNEANTLLDPAIKHINHKKYKRIWQAYLNGKQHAENIISEIVNNIEQYREIVKANLNNAKLPLTIRKKENLIKAGEYSQKWINHLIFYDVLKKYKTGATDKQLELFPVSLSFENFHLEWCDRDIFNIGLIGGKIVATGDRASMENLQNVLKYIENNKEIETIVKKIDVLKANLKNNPELKLFEEGRLKIVNQVMELRKPLHGKCGWLY